MMKKGILISIFSIFLFLFGCKLNSVKEFSNVSGFNLLGNVSSMGIYSYEPNVSIGESRISGFTEIVNDKENLLQKLKEFHIKELEYTMVDQSGNVLEELEYYSDTNQNTLRKYEYDDKGNKISKKISKFDQVVYCRENYSYSDDNKLIEKKEYNWDSFAFKSLYNYNEIGLLEEELRFNSKDSLFISHYYIYNEFGDVIEFKTVSNSIRKSKNVYENSKLISSLNFDWHGKVENGVINNYNLRGDKISIERLGENSVIRSKEFLYYDLNGNVELSEVFDENDILRKRVKSTYNKSGGLKSEIEEEFNGLGDIVGNRSMKSNEMNDIVNVLINYPEDSFSYPIEINSIYKYDDIGNWIEVKESNDQSSFRNITYF